MSDQGDVRELWDVVDDLYKIVKDIDGYSDAFRKGINSAIQHFDAVLHRLNIPRKRVCGECRLSAPFTIDTVICEYPVAEKMPIAIGWTRHAVEKTRDASKCSCYRPKEAKEC